MQSPLFPSFVYSSAVPVRRPLAGATGVCTFQSDFLPGPPSRRRSLLRGRSPTWPATTTSSPATPRRAAVASAGTPAASAAAAARDDHDHDDAKAVDRAGASPKSNVRGAGGGAIELLAAVGRLAGPLYAQPHRVAAIAWTVAVVTLALASTLYAVGLSVVLRIFWNTVSSKDTARFANLMKLYCVAVVVGPVVISAFEWVKGRLALFWRRALTTKMLGDYLTHGAQPYYKITAALAGPTIDNSDQRLSDDIRGFTERAVRFLCVFGVAFFDLIVFSIVLFKIYQPLFYIVVAYSLIGTLVISFFGRSLLGLNAAQVAREADYRFSLLRIRDNAESIAFYRGEASELQEAMRRFNSICTNTVNLLGMNRNVSFLANSHRYWIQVIPSFVTVPAYFAGKIVLGAVSQTLFAFNHVLGSLGLVVAEFSALSEFGAGVRRLERLSQAIDEAQQDRSDGTLGIITTLSDPDKPIGLAVENLSLQTPPPGRQPLVQNFSITLNAGERLLITGASGIGKTSLLRAIAGLWTSGTGHVTRPGGKDILFLPQRPFLTLGSLRENILYPKHEYANEHITDEQVLAALDQVNLSTVAQRMGGLNASGEVIGRRLSLGEQQRLAFARLVMARPKLVFLDESTSALDEENERLMYKVLSDLGTTYVSISNRGTLVKSHDSILDLNSEGTWDVTVASKC